MKRTVLLPLLGAVAGAMLLSSCGPAKVMEPQAVAQARTDAYVVLLRSADDKDPFARCAAIEALADVRGARDGKLFLQALQDKDPVVRFAAALAAGTCCLQEAKPRLISMADDKTVEPDRRVYIGVIYALYRLGEIRYCTDLVKMLLEDREVEVRGAAAEVMGMMGERSAIRPLKLLHDQEVNARNPQARWQAAESLARLGDSLGENLIAGYTCSAYQDERLFGARAMEQIVRPSFVPALESLLSGRKQVPAVKVIAGGALARQGEFRADAYDLCIRSLRDPQKVFTDGGISYGPAQMVQECNKLQLLSAIALADMHRQEAVDTLRPVLQSPSGQVRVAAARSILLLIGDIDTLSASAATQASTAPAPAAKAAPAVPATQPAAQEQPHRPLLKTAGAKD